MYWSTNHNPSRADIRAGYQKEICRLRNEIRLAYQFIEEAKAEEKRLKAFIDQE